MDAAQVAEIESSIGARLDAGEAREAVTVAVRAYGPQILGYLEALCRDGATADELFAQFCEDVWRGLPGFRRECTLRAWAYRVAYSALLRYRKDAFRRRAQPLQTDQFAALAAEVRTATRSYLRTDTRERFARLRARLEDDEQTLLVLRVDKKLSWSEVALVLAGDGEALGEAALRKRFERLKSKLHALAREDTAP